MAQNSLYPVFESLCVSSTSLVYQLSQSNNLKKSFLYSLKNSWFLFKRFSVNVCWMAVYFWYSGCKIWDEQIFHERKVYLDVLQKSIWFLKMLGNKFHPKSSSSPWLICIIRQDFYAWLALNAINFKYYFFCIFQIKQWP